MKSDGFDLDMLQWSLKLMWNILLATFSGPNCTLLTAGFKGYLNSWLRSRMRWSLRTRHDLSVDDFRAIKPRAFCHLSHTQQWVCGDRRRSLGLETPYKLAVLNN